ncbi:MAG: hypothetical protein A2471_04610 [Omnitrophica WOR_2 bacterium RIFOXYC2_FULL_45_15]|nr:MAG: hypothetical protein A2471_04610 [Omnitrophica WOR_2 bacterium RIFOXYC2_FULL_45_15]
MIRNRRPVVPFYFDEDVSIVVAKIIRAHGFKVICASEVKECGITDEEQLKYAAKNNYVLVTHNIRDFIKLHKDSTEKEFNHGGIILARRRRDNYEFARRLLEFLKETEIDDLSNQVRYV